MMYGGQAPNPDLVEVFNTMATWEETHLTKETMNETETAEFQLRVSDVELTQEDHSSSTNSMPSTEAV